MSFCLPEGWEKFFIHRLDELDSIAKVLIEKSSAENKIILPPYHMIMRPFRETSIASLKVVILGQDPYPNSDIVDGLAFSVRQRSNESSNLIIPPSLKNIFEEIEDEYGKISFAEQEGGNLSCWTAQGVLLLNTSLTIEPRGEMRHDFLWRGFVKKCVQDCSKRGDIVFMLWGKEAQKFDKEIDKSRNLVLAAMHPSPRNKKGGFRGCKHFSKANEYLISKGKRPILW